MNGVPVKARPMIFNAEMVRALLDGRKTQTRRLVDPQPTQDGVLGIEWKGEWWDREIMSAMSPWGHPNELLWVRETWYPVDWGLVLANNKTDYRASMTKEQMSRLSRRKWRSPIHMHRVHSRIDLKITRTHIERLNDISEEDAIAEGIRKVGQRWEVDSICATPISAVNAYRCLWEYINGKDSWAENPWVWVIKFEVIKPSKDGQKHEETTPKT